MESLDYPIGNHDRKRLEVIQTVLKSWTANYGVHGKIFDGVNHTPDTSFVAHYEMSALGEGELKEIAGFQISHTERLKIMKMPRHLKKMFIIDEGKKYHDTRGGEATIEELYAQMRKYSCQTIFTTQQIQQFMKSNIAKIILGQSKQFYLFAQNSKSEVFDLINNIEGIPNSAAEHILTYQTPENLSPKFSEFTFFQRDGVPAICGSGRLHTRKVKSWEEAHKPLPKAA